jgi:acetylornithine/succinyldiaminopimelate/putrescine aminotransferase
LINAPRPNSLRLMPSLRVSEAELDELIALLTNALTAEAAQSAGSVASVAGQSLGSKR